MKLNLVTATLILAAVSQAAIMPENVGVKSLTTREYEMVNNAIANLNSYNKKRSVMSPNELTKRESQIVTDILTIVKDTNLAPTVIEYFISDPTLSQIAQNVIVTAIKDGWINLSTLLKSLNDSGLAVDVIKNLISDCAFYAQIFKLVAQQLANLPQLIGNILGLNSQQVAQSVEKAKRDALAAVELANAEQPSTLVTRDTQEILTSLMESLKNSGLANQVVEALVVDDDFYTFGASLIKQLFESGAITLGELLDALIQSGLIPSIIEAFLNIDTLKTVIVTALAAAFGNCKDTSSSSTFATTPTGSAAPTITTGTPDPSITSLLTLTSATTTGGPSKCKKKRRSY
ncbi:uncharacterized protein KGF55_001307 [Candida pseudojiufengensis]|uniref:uncharacterized protein n=1 Tax=Candida pseudojiufengensis TaxID=497109 RepID=UPI002223FBD6|nr:uncharacterized protein KGF55_001307 [Candida pseudojiufengensis]KAI5965943.1 hypothetical protein KGF55_001307 [Candida pseudojiufengensis]